MSTAPSELPGRPSVLFLDDEPEVTRGLALSLRRARFRVLTANTVGDARALLDREPVDVIVSDEQMPEMRGSTFLAELRAHRPDITRILLTGQGDLDTVKSALNDAEIFRFLTKPCRPEDLRAAVEDALAARERYLVWSSSVERDAGVRRLHAAFDEALGALWMATQPIVAQDGSLFAFEALVRVDSATLRGPGDLFAAAYDLGRTLELERAIRDLVGAVATSLPAGAALFCNIEPETLLDEALYAPDTPLARAASRVVVEITERAPLTKIPGFEDRIARLRAMGFRLALDDFGAGSAGFSALANLRPDVVKFDMDLIRGIDADPSKERTVAMMLTLCKGLGALVLAEGVETEPERDKLHAMGFELFQGYWFARPARPFPPIVRR